MRIYSYSTMPLVALPAYQLKHEVLNISAYLAAQVDIELLRHALRHARRGDTSWLRAPDEAAASPWQTVEHEGGHLQRTHMARRLRCQHESKRVV